MSPREAGESTVLAMMTVTTLFWGGAFVASKLSFTELPAMTVMFLRFTVATPLILVIALRDGLKPPTRSDLPLLVSLGMAGIFIYNIFQFNALIYTTAGNAATINALVPLTSSVIASLVLGEKLTRRRVFCIALALVGVLSIITGGDPGVLLSLGFNRGDLLMLGAMLCFSVYSVYSRRATSRLSPLTVTAYAFLLGYLPMIPLAVADGSLARVGGVSAYTWGLILFMAVFSSVFGYLAQQVALKRIGVARTMLFMNLVPVFSMILSVIILGDVVTPLKAASAGLIIAAVAYNSLEKPPA